METVGFHLVGMNSYVETCAIVQLGIIITNSIHVRNSLNVDGVRDNILAYRTMIYQKHVCSDWPIGVEKCV